MKNTGLLLRRWHINRVLYNVQTMVALGAASFAANNRMALAATIGYAVLAIDLVIFGIDLYRRNRSRPNGDRS
jgi:hypothetical protein